MAETRKQYVAAGTKTIHHTAIHHDNHKACHQYASGIHFYLTL
jgi:hypothetical protein